MKNILFVLSHYDDEAFVSGTISKLANTGNNISIMIICGNGNSLDDTRSQLFLDNCKLLKSRPLNVKYFDLTLGDLDSSINKGIKDSISGIIDKLNITHVYTHYSGDLHSDHRLVSEWVRVCARPSTRVKALYECYIPGASNFGNGDLKEFTKIVNISEYANIKGQCLANYKNYLKGASSHEASLNHSKYIGSLYDIEYAECFKIIFTKE